MFEALKLAAQAAAQAARELRTPESRQAAVDASAALSAFIAANPAYKPKASGYSSRAGRQQALERRVAAIAKRIPFAS